MDKPIKEYKKGDLLLKIYVDDTPESPREWDNLGKMFCFHRKYDLGDEHTEMSSHFCGWKEVEEYLVKEKKAVVIMPLFLYDHSGLRMKIGSFSGLLPQGHAEFDSGQVGFIYATKEDIRKEFGVKKIGKKIMQKVVAILEQEVSVYDQWLSGDVYGFSIVEYEHCDCCNKGSENVKDSCWGFYGSDFKENGLFEHTCITDWEEVSK